MFAIDHTPVAVSRVQQLRSEARRDGLGRRAAAARRLSRRTQG